MKFWNSNFFHILLFSFCLLISCPSHGQAQVKKVLTDADYGKFGTLQIKQFSSDGKWVSYEMQYENKVDTLFLQDVASKQATLIPRGKDSAFGGMSFFAWRVGSNLLIKNLKDGSIETLEDVKRFEFSRDGKHLLVLQPNGNLLIKDLRVKKEECISDVSNYVTNDKTDGVLFTKKYQGKYLLGYFSFKKNETLPLLEEVAPISRMVWQKDGESVGFMVGDALRFLDLKTRKLYSLPMEVKNEPLKIADGALYPIILSDEGEKVFFSVVFEKPKVTDDKREQIEVWNGTDVCLFPVRQVLEKISLPLLAVWLPKKGIFRVLVDSARYFSRLGGKQDYVVLSDPYQYGLEPTYYEKVDYYIKNVRTGSEKLLLEKQSHDPNQLCFSPLSNEMVYYRNKHWWYYNPETDFTQCLTENIQTKWDNTTEDVPHQFRVYGVAGWSIAGTSVLLYDENDVWKVALDGSSYERITDGWKEDKVYRIVETGMKGSTSNPYERDNRKLVDLNKGIVLEVTNQKNWFSGYVLYTGKRGLQVVDYGDKHHIGIKKNRGKQFVYASERYSESAQLMYVDVEKKISKVLYESNKHQRNYLEKKSTLLSYTNEKGQVLKAALFYPDGYDEKRKCPMIVSIYDKKSMYVNHFSKPSFQNSVGFCVSNFTADQYFVLYPDIAYEKGNPGFSASDCVIAAVKAAIATGMVDEKRIGLIGHSFGGYETDFILTQTNLFATAVSGAGVSDPIGRYFGLGNDYIHKDEMWRFETQQWRMGSTFFENKSGYWSNSALVNADKITTPLLQWAGKDDTTVPFEQSVSLYMALRRLGKPTILLGYPKEGHNVSNPENQKDLTIRIKQWFDYFLKDKKDVGWIVAGTTVE